MNTTTINKLHLPEQVREVNKLNTVAEAAHGILAGQLVALGLTGTAVRRFDGLLRKKFADLLRQAEDRLRGAFPEVFNLTLEKSDYTLRVCLTMRFETPSGNWCYRSQTIAVGWIRDGKLASVFSNGCVLPRYSVGQVAHWVDRLSALRAETSRLEGELLEFNR
jgi:hypothetical protein